MRTKPPTKPPPATPPNKGDNKSTGGCIMILKTISGLQTEPQYGSGIYEIIMSNDGQGVTVVGKSVEGGENLSEGDLSFTSPHVMSKVGAAMIEAAVR